MAKGRFACGMMEIDVGLAAPIGVVEMLRHFLGGRIAERVLFSGERFTPANALSLGLRGGMVRTDGADGSPPSYAGASMICAETWGCRSRLGGRSCPRLGLA